MSGLPSISTDALQVTGRFEDGAMTLHFAGSADSRAMTLLDLFLVQINEEAQRLALRVVTVDFRDFEFMNSSCFKAFITWVANDLDLEASKQYKIRFVSSRKRHWQNRSLEALRGFASDLVFIEP